MAIGDTFISPDAKSSWECGRPKFRPVGESPHPPEAGFEALSDAMTEGVLAPSGLETLLVARPEGVLSWRA